MILTTGATALMSSGVGVLGSAGVAWFVARATHRSDHAREIWARQVELYGDLVADSRTWESQRRANRPIPLTREDEARADDLMTRSEMFGQAKVWRAYNELLAEHSRWFALEQRLLENHAANKEAGAPEMPPIHSEESMREVVMAAHAAREASDDLTARFRRVVRATTGRVPRLPRGSQDDER